MGQSIIFIFISDFFFFYQKLLRDSHFLVLLQFPRIFIFLVYSILNQFIWVIIMILLRGWSNPTRMERVILVQEALDSGECYML